MTDDEIDQLDARVSEALKGVVAIVTEAGGDVEYVDLTISGVDHATRRPFNIHIEASADPQPPATER